MQIMVTGRWCPYVKINGCDPKARKANSCVDQATLLTQDVEDSFLTKNKVRAVFVDLTAAYDTVWYRGFTCKLLRLLRERHMVHMIMKMVGNRSFTLTTGNGQRSRLRHLKNGVPRGTILSPFLISIYISALPTTIFRKYAYADCLAIMHADRDWKAVEGALSKDMATVGEYLQTCKLKLSTTQTLSAAFHLSNKEAKHKMKVNFNNETLTFCSEPKYLRVTLDRSLTYRWHFESRRKERSSRVALLRQLVGSGWGAGAKTLRTATRALVHSIAEYCKLVWCCSAHIRLIHSTIKDSLRIVTGCLRPTPADNLPILVGIQPAEFRLNGATLSLARRAIEPGDLFHSAVTCPSSADPRRLTSRQPFAPAAQQLINLSDNSSIRAAQWTDHQLNAEWAINPKTLRIFDPETGTHTRMTLPRRAWVWLNRFRTGVGRSCLYKWGMASSATCECGAEQTVDHAVLQCPIHRPPQTAWPDGSGSWNNQMAAQYLPRNLGWPSSV